jgi:hypothetical protein
MCAYAAIDLFEQTDSSSTATHDERCHFTDHFFDSSAMRVIFDRSAFHGERFAALAASPLLQLVASKRVVITHTPVFLDETLSSFGSARAGDEWCTHMAFALDVCNGGIFLDKEQIWHNELVCGRGPFARHLIPERPSKNYGSRPRLIETIRQRIATGDLSKEWAESAAEREDAQQKRTNQKAISREVREEVADGLRTRRLTGSLAGYPFKQFQKSEFTHTGRLLMGLVDSRRAEALAAQWERAPTRCPFYSAFVEGFLFHGYHAAVEHNQRIDRNAQADYEQLAYLTWADLVVSNDEGFFRAAFDAIWRPRGKRLESAESFAMLVERLA